MPSILFGLRVALVLLVTLVAANPARPLRPRQSGNSCSTYYLCNDYDDDGDTLYGVGSGPDGDDGLSCHYVVPCDPPSPGCIGSYINCYYDLTTGAYLSGQGQPPCPTPVCFTGVDRKKRNGRVLSEPELRQIYSAQQERDIEDKWAPW